MVFTFWIILKSIDIDRILSAVMHRAQITTAIDSLSREFQKEADWDPIFRVTIVYIT